MSMKCIFFCFCLQCTSIAYIHLPLGGKIQPEENAGLCPLGVYNLWGLGSCVCFYPEVPLRLARTPVAGLSLQTQGHPWLLRTLQA